MVEVLGDRGATTAGEAELLADDGTSIASCLRESLGDGRDRSATAVQHQRLVGPAEGVVDQLGHLAGIPADVDDPDALVLVAHHRVRRGGELLERGDARDDLDRCRRPLASDGRGESGEDGEQARVTERQERHHLASVEPFDERDRRRIEGCGTLGVIPGDVDLEALHPERFHRRPGDRLCAGDRVLADRGDHDGVGGGDGRASSKGEQVGCAGPHADAHQERPLPPLRRGRGRG